MKSHGGQRLPTFILAHSLPGLVLFQRSPPLHPLRTGPTSASGSHDLPPAVGASERFCFPQTVGGWRPIRSFHPECADSALIHGLLRSSVRSSADPPFGPPSLSPAPGRPGGQTDGRPAARSCSELWCESSTAAERLHDSSSSSSAQTSDPGPRPLLPSASPSASNFPLLPFFFSEAEIRSLKKK